MNPRTRTTMAVFPLAALLTGCATSKVLTAPAVPEALKAPPTQAPSLEAHATGVQIYECKPGKADPTRYEWVFKAPEAVLFDGAGKRIGTHFAGPTWESDDGSRVVGAVKARDDGPDPGAIPWLLLAATSNSGTGVFGSTRSIQRVSTDGGKAPASGCDQAHANAEARVPYKAVYVFYAAKP